MGLNNGPSDSQVWESDHSEDEDEYRIERDEDYYTSKYVRMRQRKSPSPMSVSTRKSFKNKGVIRATNPSAPGNTGKRKNMHSHQTSKKNHFAAPGKELVDRCLSHKSSAKTMSSSGKPVKTRQISRQMNRFRKTLDETVVLAGHDSGASHNIENMQPPNTDCNHDTLSDKTVFNSLLPEAEVQPSNMSALLKSIGVKRGTSTKEASSVPKVSVAPLPTSSPFVQALDPTIFKSSGAPISVSPPRSRVIGDTPLGGDGGNDGSVTHAIFHALFGETQEVNSSSSGASCEDIEEEGDGELVISELISCKANSTEDEEWGATVLRSRSNSWGGGIGGAKCNNNPTDLPDSLSPPRRSRSSSLTRSPLLSRANVVTEITPMLSSAAFEYAMNRASSSSNKTELATASAVSNSDSSGITARREVRVTKQGLGNITGQSSRSPQVFDQFVTPELVTQLVLQVAHDAPQMPSSRLSVLMTLHKNCSALRDTIHKALVQASHNRVLRCQENSHVAKSQGIHYTEASEAVFRRDFSLIGTNEGDEKCGGNGVPGLQCPPVNSAATTSTESDGKASINFHDHDGSIIELARFVAVATFSSHQSTGTPPVPPRAADAQATFQSLVSVIVNALRCYGVHLTSAIDINKDCSILKSTKLIVHITLNYFKRLDAPADVSVSHAEQWLQQLLKYWPRGDTTRELAYWQVVAEILPFTVTAPSASPLKASSSIPVGSLMKVQMSPSRRVLKKLLVAVNSTHYKLALQALQVVMNPAILFPFVAAPVTVQGESVLCGNQVLRGEMLIAALRSNKQHWHASVQMSSDRALEILLDTF